MFKKAFIHIGQPKTGTSTLQEFLFENKDNLLNQGFIYPDFMGPNHTSIVFIGYEENRWDEEMARRSYWENLSTKKPSLENWIKYLNRVKENLKSLSEIHHDKKLIISSENFYTHLIDDDIVRFKKFIKTIAKEVYIIFYAREPIRHRISHINSWIMSHGISLPSLRINNPEKNFWYKSNSVTPLSIKLKESPPLEDFSKRISFWEDNFPGNLKIGLFERNSFLNGNLLMDFCQKLGISWLDAYKIPKKQNESVSWSMLKVINKINPKFPVFNTDGTFNSNRDFFNETIRKIDKNQLTYKPSINEIVKFSQYFHDSDKWLKEIYFPSLEKLWTNPMEAIKENEQYIYEDDLNDQEQLIRNFIEEFIVKENGFCVSGQINFILEKENICGHNIVSSDQGRFFGFPKKYIAVPQKFGPLNKIDLLAGANHFKNSYSMDALYKSLISEKNDNNKI